MGRRCSVAQEAEQRAMSRAAMDRAAEDANSKALVVYLPGVQLVSSQRLLAAVVE